MADKKNKVFKFIADLWNARGICWRTAILLAIYTSVLIWDISTLFGALSDHVTQAWTLALAAVLIPLFLRTVKRMFDAKQVDAIYEFIHRLSLRINEFLDKFGRKIIKWLGIDKILRYGKDEREFIFRERKKGLGRKAKLYNPMTWEEQIDNSEKVRFIYTDYMIAKIKDGYHLRPSKTPTDIEGEIANTDEEHLLFDTYTIARYSGGREEITDETVDILYELNPNKKRRRR